MRDESRTGLPRSEERRDSTSCSQRLSRLLQRSITASTRPSSPTARAVGAKGPEDSHERHRHGRAHGRLLPARVALRPRLRARLTEIPMGLEYLIGLLLSLALLAYLAYALLKPERF